MINRILLVDDSQDNLDLLKDLLDEEFNNGGYPYEIKFLQAINGQESLDIVEANHNIDLILLDVMMDGIDGFEVCRRLKQNESTKDIPIIFISAKSESVDIVQGFNLGGSDYIIKPFQGEELLARVKKELKIKSLIKYLEFLASHDTMTGIYNRRKFFELATKEFEKNSANLYTIMIDIDNFKIINDTYGHHVGDKVIILAVDTINSLLLNEMIFGRLGGEEFAIIFNISSQSQVKEIAEQLRQAIESLEVLTDEKEIVKFTISLGIEKRNENTKDIDELLKQADIALYEAKKTGRNKSIFRGR